MVRLDGSPGTCHHFALASGPKRDLGARQVAAYQFTLLRSATPKTQP